MRKFGARYGRTIRDIEPAVRDVFLSYKWPGNVRELENLLERIFILEEDRQILVRHIPPRIMREVDGSGSGAAGTSPFEDRDPDGSEDTGSADFYSRTQAFQRRMIDYDEAANMEHVPWNKKPRSTLHISTGPTKVLVIATNEELVIARDTQEILFG